MLYHLLVSLSDQFSALNVFRYITFRTGGAIMTALLFVFMFGPGLISMLRLKQGRGQPIRLDGPQRHILEKQGTPTMGGLVILSGIMVATLLWADLTNLYVWAVLFVTLGFGAIGFYDDLLKVTRTSGKGLFGPRAAAAGSRDRRHCGLYHHEDRRSRAYRARWPCRSSRIMSSSSVWFSSRLPLWSSSGPAMRSTSPTGSTGSPSCR
jgi:hypothetical protein